MSVPQRREQGQGQAARGQAEAQWAGPLPTLHPYLFPLSPPQGAAATRSASPLSLSSSQQLYIGQSHWYIFTYWILLALYLFFPRAESSGLRGSVPSLASRPHGQRLGQDLPTYLFFFPFNLEWRGMLLSGEGEGGRGLRRQCCGLGVKEREGRMQGMELTPWPLLAHPPWPLPPTPSIAPGPSHALLQPGSYHTDCLDPPVRPPLPLPLGHQPASIHVHFYLNKLVW